jgi:hypothetical protein
VNDDKEMDKARNNHKLTHLIDSIRDIKSSDSKIDKNAKQMPIQIKIT